MTAPGSEPAGQQQVHLPGSAATQPHICSSKVVGTQQHLSPAGRQAGQVASIIGSVLAPRMQVPHFVHPSIRPGDGLRGPRCGSMGGSEGASPRCGWRAGGLGGQQELWSQHRGPQDGTSAREVQKLLLVRVHLNPGSCPGCHPTPLASPLVDGEVASFW